MLDSNRTYKATDCNDAGRKYYLSWANNDTLIYSNTTDGYLYGIDVSSIITSVEQMNDDVAISDFNISNYPNPFNPTTTIKYSLKESCLVRVKVHDILGSKIAELVNEKKEAGNHSIEFSASNLTSGVYIYTLESNGFFTSNKMILLK